MVCCVRPHQSQQEMTSGASFSGTAHTAELDSGSATSKLLHEIAGGADCATLAICTLPTTAPAPSAVAAVGGGDSAGAAVGDSGVLHSALQCAQWFGAIHNFPIKHLSEPHFASLARTLRRRAIELQQRLGLRRDAPPENAEESAADLKSSALTSDGCVCFFCTSIVTDDHY
jgi:hypothetical protein